MRHLAGLLVRLRLPSSRMKAADESDKRLKGFLRVSLNLPPQTENESHFLVGSRGSKGRLMEMA